MIPEFRPWTKAEESVLVNLWNTGAHAAEIGKAMERSRHAIIARAGKLRLGKRRPHKMRGPDTLNQVRRLVREGLSSSQIGERLGFHESTIREWRREMDLSVPRGAQVKTASRVIVFPTQDYTPRLAEKAADGGDGIAFGAAHPNQCKWPLWADTERTGSVCGCAATPGRPYCETHAKRAFRTQPATLGGVADYSSQPEAA